MNAEKNNLHIDAGFFQVVGGQGEGRPGWGHGFYEQWTGYTSRLGGAPHSGDTSRGLYCTGKKEVRPNSLPPALVISAHRQVHKSENIEFCHDGETQEDAVKGKAHTP